MDGCAIGKAPETWPWNLTIDGYIKDLQHDL